MTHLSDTLNSYNRQNLSARQIADRAAQLGHEVHFTTVARYLKPDYTPKSVKQEVLEAFSAVLGVSLEILEQAAGVPATVGEFKLPKRADKLSRSERAVILSMIDALIDAKTPATDSVTDFHPERAGYNLAAHHDKEARARIDWLDSLGEEPQD